MKELNKNQMVEIKSRLSQAESAVKRIPISALSVTDESLKAGRILVSGQPIAASNRFFTMLGSLLKVNASLTKDMIKKGDTKVAAALINGLKDYQSINKKDNDIMLIANIDSKEIVDVCRPDRYKRVTNDTLFDVTERILDINSHLSVETIDFNPGNGRASINMLNEEEIGFAQAGKDEYFKFGFSIIQTNKDTLVETYNQRLICANGLRTSLGEGAIGGSRDIRFEDKFRLGGTSSEDIRTFLNQIEEMKKNGFVPSGFEQTINRAMETKASLFEVENCMKNAIKRLKDPDEELLKQYKSTLARNYFHVHSDTEARLVRKGVDPLSLGNKQKQFIKTGMSIWDVVNSMTFLGSNNTGLPLENNYELKYSAGELFSKGVKEGYDLEFAQYASL